MMRVGLDVRCLSQSGQAYSGIGNYTFGLLKALTAIDHQNQYTLFESTGDVARLNDLELPGNFVRVLVPASRVDQLEHQIRLARRIHEAGLHVFHSPFHAIASLFPRVPLIVTVHDLFVIDFPSSSWIHRTFFRFVSYLALRRACHVICDSNSTKQVVERCFPFCRRKSSIIYQGYDPYFQRHKDPASYAGLRRQFAIEPPFILYVGSFEKRKNVANMVRAFDILRTTRPDLQFVIVGKPGSRYDVIPSEYPPGVVRTGLVSKRELRTLYNEAELFLFTTFYEGFGIPVLEAMACGCAVLTSPMTSLPEVGEDATLYAMPDRPREIAAQALRVLNGKDLRRDMITRGLKQVLRFSWDNAARRVLQVYQRCAQ